MDEQEAREARHEQAWERYMEAERKDLRMRAEGHLARILGHALPDEAPEELARLAEEDQLRASEGLVELMDEHGEITHRLIDELTPQNRSARIRAEGRGSSGSRIGEPGALLSRLVPVRLARRERRRPGIRDRVFPAGTGWDVRWRPRASDRG